MRERLDKGTKKGCAECQRLLGAVTFTKHLSQGRNNITAAHALGDLGPARAALHAHKQTHATS